MLEASRNILFLWTKRTALFLGVQLLLQLLFCFFPGVLYASVKVFGGENLRIFIDEVLDARSIFLRAYYR